MLYLASSFVLFILLFFFGFGHFAKDAFLSNETKVSQLFKAITHQPTISTTTSRTPSTIPPHPLLLHIVQEAFCDSSKIVSSSRRWFRHYNLRCSHLLNIKSIQGSRKSLLIEYHYYGGCCSGEGMLSIFVQVMREEREERFYRTFVESSLQGHLVLTWSLANVDIEVAEVTCKGNRNEEAVK